MNGQKKVAFYTLGCKLNFSETSTIARNFQDDGFERVNFDTKADIYVINTCSVTENADKKFKTVVKSALKQNPKAFLIAIGCYAQLKPETLAQVDGVDLVLGATEKFKVTDYINDLSKNDLGEVHSCEIEEANFYVGSYSFGDRVNIGDYGKGEHGDKKHESTFLDLVKALDNVEGIHRLRISSIEPNLLKNETIEFVKQSNSFVPHFHIPLQSGSNTLLKLMKRRYLKELYVERVNKIKSLMPDACIGVDVIVGFPGEKDELFLETYNFLNELNISYLHVFTYSERPNTEAILMDNVVPLEVRHKRSKMLRGLSVKKRRAFYESQLGKTRTVLFESDNKNGFMHGFTENYVKIKTPFDKTLINTLKQVKLSKIDRDGLVLFDWVKQPMTV